MKNIFATAGTLVMDALTPLIKLEENFIGKINLGNGQTATVLIPIAAAAAQAAVSEVEVEDGHDYPAVDATLQDATAAAMKLFPAPAAPAAPSAPAKTPEEIAQEATAASTADEAAGAELAADVTAVLPDIASDAFKKGFAAVRAAQAAAADKTGEQAQQ